MSIHWLFLRRGRGEGGTAEDGPGIHTGFSLGGRGGMKGEAAIIELLDDAP